MKEARVVHYLNQFFGQIGGEDKAGEPPQSREGAIGPGLLLDTLLKPGGRIVGTIICGDNYFADSKEDTVGRLVELARSFNPDLLIAGPAFNAGRYGIACGEVCSSASRILAIPAVTGMFRENPGVELYRRQTYIVETKGSAAGMKGALSKMAPLALKLVTGSAVGSPSEDGYIPRGIRRNRPVERGAAERAVAMLLAKLSGAPYVTEVSNPEAVPKEPAPPLEDVSSAVIALVTEGGLVPKGNPDRIEGARCTKFARYDLGPLSGAVFECIHRGFDVSRVNEDPNRLVPGDVLREMEQQGEVGRILPFFYSTCGCGTFVKEAQRIGRELAESLKKDGASGVILSAT